MVNSFLFVSFLRQDLKQCPWLLPLPSSECWNCRSPPPHEFITRWGSNPGLGTLGMHSTKGAMRLYVSANTGWTSVTLIRELFNMIQMCTFSLKEKWCSLLNNLLLDTSENQEHFVYPL